MTIITGKENNQIAFVHNHTILVPESQEVLGVIIGDCVYGKKGAFKGKYINKKIYSPEGEMLATEIGSTGNTVLDFSMVMHQSWNVINSIRNHISPWVEIKNNWATYSFPEFLLS
jgi:hypothetical protein